MFSTLPPLCGFLMMALLPNEAHYKWVKWGGYFSKSKQKSNIL